MYPLWGKFIELLADHAVAEGEAEEKDAKRWKADTTSTPQQRVQRHPSKVGELGEPLYRNFLRATFGPRKGPDGRRYTATHAALLHVPFRAYVTTNYDPALEFARAELRPESLSTGTPTWEDDEEVYRWRTGDVFDDDCPMLWIHGYWQRPAGIVLNSGEYSQAYKPGIYHDTFKDLWVRERLVFLGFGFNDPQFTFMVGEFLRDLRDANAEPRHVAILGLPVEKDGRLPDAEAIRERRENLEADYHVCALFAIIRGSRSSWNTSRNAVVLPGSLPPRRPSRRQRRPRLSFQPSGSTRPATTRNSRAVTTRSPGSIAGCAMPRCASSLSAPWGGTDRAHRPSPRDCGYAWAERDALSSKATLAPPSPPGTTPTTPPPPPATARCPGATGPTPRPSPPGLSSVRRTSPRPTPRLGNG
jgi:hypothetical protein